MEEVISQEKLKRIVAIILVTLILFGVFGPTTSVAVNEIANEVEAQTETVAENSTENIAVEEKNEDNGVIEYGTKVYITRNANNIR